MDITQILEAVKSAPQKELGRVSVDISEGLGLTEGQAVVCLRELTTAEMFAVPRDGARIQKRNPLLPAELCQAVALLAMAHEGAAQPGQAAELYTGIAQKSRPLFTLILTKYRSAFPDAVDLGDDSEEAKAGRGEDSGGRPA